MTIRDTKLRRFSTCDQKFKIAFTVPGDNSVDLYINDIGCVVIMEPDGVTLKGFNIVVGGGMGRTHGKEATFARAAAPVGFVKRRDFFAAMKAKVVETTQDLAEAMKSLQEDDIAALRKDFEEVMTE